MRPGQRDRIARSSRGSCLRGAGEDVPGAVPGFVLAHPRPELTSASARSAASLSALAAASSWVNLAGWSSSARAPRGWNTVEWPRRPPSRLQPWCPTEAPGSGGERPSRPGRRRDRTTESNRRTSALSPRPAWAIESATQSDSPNRRVGQGLSLGQSRPVARRCSRVPPSARSASSKA